jgi:hypothetical protein
MSEEILQTVGASHFSDGLEAIAYMLFLETWLDMDETIADLSDDVLRSLGTKWKNEWLPMKNSDHCGDCTKMPATCIRCVLDEWYKQAARIVAANAELSGASTYLNNQETRWTLSGCAVVTPNAKLSWPPGDDD